MDRQKLFDQAVEHMLVQGEISAQGVAASGLPACKYRGPRQLRCGIGGIIPDAMYHPRMENVAIKALVWSTCDLAYEKELAEYFGVENQQDANLLEAIQSIHDSCSPKSWMEAFEKVAKDYGLRWTWDADAVLESSNIKERTLTNVGNCND